jgi:hypothetical protein
MNVVNFNERSCQRYRRYFDAYLDNELLVETNQDVLQHIGSCAECSRILDERQRARQFLRDAIGRESAPPELTAAIRGRLRERHTFFSSTTTRLVIASAAVLLLSVLAFQVSPWAPGGNDNRAGLFQTISAGARDLLRVGLIDHVHCAILSQRWKQSVSVEAMKEDKSNQGVGAEFIDLVPMVQEKLGSGYKLVQAHRCLANQRHYVHLILTGEAGTVVSLVITEKKNESFLRADAVAVLNAQGVPVYEDRQGTYQIAGFESDKYLAYVVSNLGHDANRNLASVLAPQVYEHLHRLEL